MKKDNKKQALSSYQKTYDLCVIGAGPGGYVCAIKASQLGLRVLCVEKRPTLGGTCLNVGCIPSKSLLHNSYLYNFINSSGSKIGLNGGLKLDLKAMMSAKNSIVKSNCSGIEYLFKKNKVDYLNAKASFSPKGELIATVEATSFDDKNQNSFVLDAKNIVIATGSKPIELKSICGFDHENVCDSTDALSFTQVPESLAIIGGGVIGLEMASIWARLGCKVDIVEMSSGLVSSMDQMLAKTITKSLKKLGIKIHLNTALKKHGLVTNEQKNMSLLTLVDATSQSYEIQAQKVLVCVGRCANVDGLNLANTKIKLTKSGQIEVDDNFKTHAHNVYAIGDVICGPMLAHKAEHDAVAVAELLAKTRSSVHKDYHLVPNVVYTHPELAGVGYTETELKNNSIDYKKGVFYLKGNARAKVMHDDSGMVVIYSDKVTDKVLGVHIAAGNASELIGIACMAMSYGASSEDIYSVCQAHPTVSESLKEAALAIDGMAIHG